MTAGPSGRVTAGALLFAENGDDPADGLARSLHERGVARSLLGAVRDLSGLVCRGFDGKIADIAADLVDLDLGDLLVAGWRKYSALIAARDRTLARPGTDEMVVLATHRLTSTHHPSVDVLIDGAKVATVAFELIVVFQLDSLVAVVRDGNLVALLGGDCLTTATLTLEEAVLAQRGRQLDLARILPLQPGIPLAHPTAEIQPQGRVCV